MILARITIGVLLTLSPAFVISAQPNDKFVSYVGGFQIATSQRPDGFSGVGSGIRYVWTFPFAKCEIGFHERQGLPLAIRHGEFSYEAAVEKYFNKFSKYGERIYEKDSAIEKHPAKDYKYKLKNSIFLLRLSLIEDRVYHLEAEIPADKESSESEVTKIFDSVQLIDKQAVDKHFAKLIEESTPEQLPQSPRAAKATTDLQDRNLSGRVKTVVTEVARYALKDSLMQRKRSLVEEFDEAGDLLKQIEYDSYGVPFMIRTFGFVGGKRVARVRSVPGETRLPGIKLDIPINLKADRRFDESTTYRYATGTLIEERHFWGHNALFARTTYRYVGRSKETQYFDGGTRPYAKKIAVLDDRGNEVRVAYFEREGAKLVEEAPFEIRYDAFDSSGNWTQRLTTRWYGLEGRGKMFPEEMEYRTILYHTN